MLKKLWKRTVEVAKLYTGTFITVMFLNQLLFFGLCLNPICLVAAMPHVLFITVVIGTWINKNNKWGKKETDITGSMNSAAKKLDSLAIKAESYAEKLKRDAEELQKQQKIRHIQARAKNDTKTSAKTFSSDNKSVSTFARYGQNSLWHITHRENIPGILKHGLLCNSSLTKAIESESIFDISDPGVQANREKLDPIYQRKIHDYVPLYINPKNPMMFKKKENLKELCLLEVSLEILNYHTFLLSDGNAASKDTKFFNSLDGVKYLPWAVLNADYWSDFDDGKRKRCSEVLISSKIEPKYFLAIHVYSEETDRYLYSVTGNSKINVYQSKDMFF